jgi:hypothetical protein
LKEQEEFEKAALKRARGLIAYEAWKNRDEEKLRLEKS